MGEKIKHGLEIKDMGERFEVARRREVKPGNSGLPNGAGKCTDEEINKLLQNAWVEEIRLYVEMRGLTGCGAAQVCGLKDYKVEEVVIPEVEGYGWYRGYFIKVKDGKVLLFDGWMQPWYEGGAPDPIVYTVGDVARNDILRLVQSYCNGILSYLEKRRRLNEVTKAHAEVLDDIASLQVEIPSSEPKIAALRAEIITLEAELATLTKASQTVLQKSLLPKR